MNAHSSDESNRIAIVLTTITAGPQGDGLARTLVEERLAACVNVLPPMTSIYQWKGAVEVEAEQQLVIKTAVALLPALEARIRELHPYELPEFLVLHAEAAPAYEEWLNESVARRSG